MCTVTIVPAGGGGSFRMACNRDESHGRPPALPPQQQTINGMTCLLPIDPGSGGTWVGVNEAGLALTLLNYNLIDPPTGRDRSRGSVIPQLLVARSVDEVISLARPIERERMMPFRLVVSDGQSLLLWRSTDPIEQAERSAWSGAPVMFTSSGLGDHLVEGPRRDLFDGWFGDDPSVYLDEQLAFHRHQWTGREHLSVCMHRADARTVSYTTVDVDPDAITMTYHPDRPDLNAAETTASLQRGLAAR